LNPRNAGRASAGKHRFSTSTACTLVILDEPSASLDARAEGALFGSVRELFPRSEEPAPQPVEQ
jgi:hypothetical protein